MTLRCTVRGCERPLAVDGTALRCAAGHSFDRAREGYWNLLQPQDRKSSRSGDRDEAVDARRRWLGRGFVDGLIAMLAAEIDRLAPRPGATIIDVGCGEGTITARLLGQRDVAACGIDLSTRAIRLAVKSAPALTWIVANADRGLPFVDGTVDLAISIFGRRPASELRRVLSPAGTLIVVVPGADDLIELREASQGKARQRDRTEDVHRPLESAFDVVAQSAWRHRVRHDRAAVEDALAMSYRGARASERKRLAVVGDIDVTLAADMFALVPRRGVR